MTTIDQVIAANEELTLAIEHLSSKCTPLSFKGMSAALEEAQEDSKEQAKEGVWAKFKAFLARIKEWFMGLFKKRESKLDELAKMEADIKKAVDSWKNSDPFKESMERFKETMAKSTMNLNSSIEAIRKQQKETAEKEQQEKEEQERAQQEQQQAAAQKEQERKQRVEADTAAARKRMQDATAVFDSKRSEVVKAAIPAVDEYLRKKFTGELSSVIKIIMSVKTQGDDIAIGKQILHALDSAKVRILRIDRILDNLASGKGSGVQDYEDGTKVDVATIREILAGSEEAQGWLSGIEGHSHEELIRAYRRYCGYVVDICSTLSANLLKRIDLAIKETIEDSEKLAQKEGMDQAAIAAVQKIYTEEIAPISADLSKTIMVYGDSLKQATAIGHLNYGAIDAIRTAAKQVLGEETYNSLNWSETIGALANEVMGSK